MPTHAETRIGRVGTDHLLYGSDYCWTPPGAVAMQVGALDAGWRSDIHRSWRDLAAANAQALLAPEGALA